MQMQEVEIFGGRKGPAFLTESIKTLNGKSCSPEVITTTIGSFICGALSRKLFLCSRAGEKGGRGRVGVRFMGRVVHPSQILAFHLTSGGRDKSPQPPSKHWHSSLVVLLPDAPWSVPGIVPWSEPGPRRLLRIVCISTPWWVLFGEKLWMAEVLIL